MKFTYVVSCQQYEIHKRCGDARAQDILRLMTTYTIFLPRNHLTFLSISSCWFITEDSLCFRVAYIDEVEEPNKNRSNDKIYYSALVQTAVSKSEENLDQIRTLCIPRSRFQSLPSAFNARLIPERSCKICSVVEQHYYQLQRGRSYRY